MATTKARRDRAALHQRWAEILAEFERSGLNGRRFCADHDLPYHQFVYHRQRVRETRSAGFKVLEPPSGTGVQLRIGEATIEVAPGFDPSLLRAVVAALG